MCYANSYEPVLDYGLYDPGFYSSDKSYIFYPAHSDMADMTPVIFYYTVDGLEPFMQVTIDKEVSDLRELCSRKFESNWVTIIGSKLGRALISNKEVDFAYCKRGHFGTIVLPEKTRQKLLRILSEHKNHQMYRELLQSPTALLEVFELFLKFASKTLFFEKGSISKEVGVPTNKYSYIIQLKSHGTASAPIVLLTEAQLKSKILAQLKILGLQDNSAFENAKTEFGLGKLRRFYHVIDRHSGEKLTAEFGNGSLSPSVAALQDYQKITSREKFEEFFSNLWHGKQSHFWMDFLFLEACSSPIELGDAGFPFWRNQFKKIGEAGISEEEYESNIPPFLGFFISKGQMNYHNLSWLDLANNIGKLNSRNSIYGALRSHLISMSGLIDELPSDTHKKK